MTWLYVALLRSTQRLVRRRFAPFEADKRIAALEDMIRLFRRSS